MNFVEHIKNILISPKSEWEKIAAEEKSFFSITIGYVLPLAILGAGCAFIGYGLIGYNVLGFRVKGMNWGYYEATSRIISSLVGFIVSTFIVDALALTFKAEKNINKSAQLVAYSSTAMLLGGVFLLLPSLSVLTILFGLYGIYLMYMGIGPIKKTPEDQKIIYLIAIIVIYALINGLILYVLHQTLDSFFGVGFGKFPLDIY